MVDAFIKYAWMRAYTECLNSDETPGIPTDPRDILHRLDPGYTAIPQIVIVPKAQPTKSASPASHSPAEVCARAKHRVVYHGKSWRCQ
jgi:hypothetical protein